MLRDIVSPTSSSFKQTANGILLFYDNSRSRFLSIVRESYTFGLDQKNISHTRWLNVVSKIRSNLTGYKIPRNALITTVSVQCESVADNCRFFIQRNDVPTNLANIPLTSQSGDVIENVNVELTGHDFLQVKLSVLSGTVDYPLLTVEVAWRE